jgi:hypothetical protein
LPKYRDDMTPAEAADLLAEVEALDRAHEEAGFLAEAHRLAWLASHGGALSDSENEWEDEAETLRRAALSRGTL